MSATTTAPRHGEIVPTATGFMVTVEGGSQTGTRRECEEFLAWVGMTEEQKAVEALFEGGHMGTGF